MQEPASRKSLHLFYNKKIYFLIILISVFLIFAVISHAVVSRSKLLLTEMIRFSIIVFSILNYDLKITLIPPKIWNFLAKINFVSQFHVCFFFKFTYSNEIKHTLDP